jgi:phosphoadenosine phosphosulfate reductase
VQVEPARRAYAELGVKAVITGRRASQGAARAGLKPLEVDETGLIKLNPLFEWTFPSVELYIQQNSVPTNKLLSQGYKSIGDWHSTVKSGDTGERGGRWAEKEEKTECGLHADYFAMKVAMKKVRGPQTDFLFCFKRRGLPANDLIQREEERPQKENLTSVQA